MSTISANEIKKRGVGAFEPTLKQDGEAIITVRGENRYVVLTMAEYNRLREAELSQAVREARADYKAGRVADRTINRHMKRLHDKI